MSSPGLKEACHLRLVTTEEERPRPLSDGELIDAFERGDLRTSEHLYDRLERVVHATLIRVLGSRGQDHDDCVQTAFEQILLTLAHKKFARACSLSSWAASVTAHVALNVIRKRQLERRTVSSDAEPSELSRPSQPAPDRVAMMAALREELGRLPAVTAEIVVMREVMGHDLAEIAVLTGLSVAAAQSRLVRGRAELKRRLEARFEKGPG